MDNTEEVVEHAANLASLLGLTAIGGVIGILVGIVILVVGKVVGRRSRLATRVLGRVRVPLVTVTAAVGIWTGFGWDDLSKTYAWYAQVQHLLLIIVIAFVGRFFYVLANIVQDMAYLRTEGDSRDGRRLKTQAQVLRRVLQIAVAVATVVSVLLTFPAARAPLASLLASAGLLSVVVGLAAQSSLGNMFAGIQLAFTDAIRVGDTVTVMMASKEQIGTIEEITLTYVVIRLWNSRRVLLPSSQFTTVPFENWTRASAEQLGMVELSVDWPVPMAQLRHEAERILNSSKEWDHRVWNVQMTGAVGTSATVRVIASAASPADRWDLECHLREKLVGWLAEEAAWALPRNRTVPEDVKRVNRDVSAQKMAELAEDLSNIAGTATQHVPVVASAEEEAQQVKDPVHAARLRASRKRAQRARRRSVYGRSVAPVPEGVEPPTDATMIMTDPTQIAQLMAPARPPVPAEAEGDDEPGSRMYSGSPDAEELRRIYDGPGAETIRRREETVQMQALDARGEAIDLAETTKQKPEKHRGSRGKGPAND